MDDESLFFYREFNNGTSDSFGIELKSKDWRKALVEMKVPESDYYSINEKNQLEIRDKTGIKAIADPIELSP